MGLETATYINQLVTTNPVGASDLKSQGDEHIRLIKATLQATFPAIAGAVSLSHAEINDAARQSVANVFLTAQTIKSATAPDLTLWNTAAPADAKRYTFRVGTGGQIEFFTQTDAGAGIENVLSATRSGAALTAVSLAPTRALTEVNVGGVLFSDFARLSNLAAVDHNALGNYVANRHRLVSAQSGGSPSGGADGDIILIY